MNMFAKLRKFIRSTIGKVSAIVFLTVLSIVAGNLFASTKVISAPASNVSCPPALEGQIYRFIEGLDKCLVPLSKSETDKLNDPFAKKLLRQGIFPNGVPDMDKKIEQKLGYKATTYMVGEGLQVPTTAVSIDNPRSIRYLFTWGKNENESHVMMSKLAPASQTSMTEVISFDEKSQEYNYYLMRPQLPEYEASKGFPFVWAFVGNSPMAQEKPSMGNGCFRCHHNGTPLMREIELPWNNWHSQRAITASALLPKEAVSESYFINRRGGDVFEPVIRGNFQKYFTNWLGQRMTTKNGATEIRDVNKMLRFLTSDTSINFKSSDVQSEGVNTSPPNLDITGVPPNDTFLADTLLQTVLGLNYKSLSVKLPRAEYDAFLKKHDFKLVGTKGFMRDSEKAFEYPGSTYFAFYVPQVGAEDIYMTQKMLQSKIVTDKFVASMLMVDFKNPLFSAKRTSLQKYAQQITTGKIVGGVSSVPGDFVNKIKQTGAKACNPNNFDACSAEEQFLYNWELPENEWRKLTADRLQTYVSSIANLEPKERLDVLMRWSVKQQNRFAEDPNYCHFFESRTLFPESDLAKFPALELCHPS
jgi:hypothetical protein